jgi:hypothetical protein
MDMTAVSYWAVALMTPWLDIDLRAQRLEALDVLVYRDGHRKSHPPAWGHSR